MAYIGWANDVNKIILDSTNVTIGEGATVQDSLEAGGLKKSRLSCSNPPDKYSVLMKFSFADSSKDENGKTELDRFWTWYKWVHKYGVNPFQFPAILINSNRHTGLSLEEREYLASRLNNEHISAHYTADNVTPKEFYIITSAVQAGKSGTDMQVQMEWQTYATGVISVPDEVSAVNRIQAENGSVDILLTKKPATEPSIQTYRVYINGTLQAISNLMYDGETHVVYFFTPKTEIGTYNVSVSGKTDSFIVS